MAPILQPRSFSLQNPCIDLEGPVKTSIQRSALHSVRQRSWCCCFCGNSTNTAISFCLPVQKVLCPGLRLFLSNLVLPISLGAHNGRTSFRWENIDKKSTNWLYSLNCWRFSAIQANTHGMDAVKVYFGIKCKMICKLRATFCVEGNVQLWWQPSPLFAKQNDVLCRSGIWNCINHCS